MSNRKLIQVWVNNEEHDKIRKAFIDQLISGECKTMADYIRQILLHASNGGAPTKINNKIESKTVSETANEKEYQNGQSKLAMDFAQLDI